MATVFERSRGWVSAAIPYVAVSSYLYSAFRGKPDHFNQPLKDTVLGKPESETPVPLPPPPNVADMVADNPDPAIVSRQRRARMLAAGRAATFSGSKLGLAGGGAAFASQSLLGA